MLNFLLSNSLHSTTGHDTDTHHCPLVGGKFVFVYIFSIFVPPFEPRKKKINKKKNCKNFKIEGTKATRVCHSLYTQTEYKFDICIALLGLKSMV